PVDMADRFLDVALGVLLLAEIPRHHRHAGITEAEVRIELHRLPEALPRLVEPVVRHRFHGVGVLPYDVERRGRKRFHGEALGGGTRPRSRRFWGRLNAVMNPAPSSAIFSTGSTVPSSRASPV